MNSAKLCGPVLTTIEELRETARASMPSKKVYFRTGLDLNGSLKLTVGEVLVMCGQMFGVKVAQFVRKLPKLCRFGPKRRSSRGRK